MKHTHKARIVSIALTALSLWPLIQMFLVARYDVSPWKLAGWGMYAAPRPQFLGLEIFGTPLEGGAPRKLNDPSPQLRTAVNEFLQRWRWLGQLAQPHDVVALARDQYPEWRELKVVASKPVLSRDSKRIELQQREFVFRSP